MGSILDNYDPEEMRYLERKWAAEKEDKRRKEEDKKRKGLDARVRCKKEYQSLLKKQVLLKKKLKDLETKLHNKFGK